MNLDPGQPNDFESAARDVVKFIWIFVPAVVVGICIRYLLSLVF